MATQRRGAYSSSMLTLAVFLSPALLAPGPMEMANLAGVALAVWFAIDAWRVYGRNDLPVTLPYRIGPVAPGLLGSAALIFVLALAHGWAAERQIAADLALTLDTALRDAWRFPLSPVNMLIAPSPGLAPLSAPTVQSIAFCLSAALALGLIFGVFSLVGGIWNKGDLRRHALIWKGVNLTAGEDALAARGARGLKPMRDPLKTTMKTPVSGRLFLRALSLLVAIVCLPYAPVFVRMAANSRIPALEKLFESSLAENAFFTIWLIGLWAMLVAAAIIFFFAYLRLAFTLRLRR